MRAPTIHLNGSSADALLDGWIEAQEALRGAGKTLERLPVNARDYYPQGPAAYGEVVARLQEMTAQLRAMRAEIAAVVEQIADAP